MSDSRLSQYKEPYMLDDKFLIWQFNRGRGEALHRIYEKYKHDLVTLAASLLTDLDLAEDVVHDVFIGFVRSAGKFRLTGSLKGYLCTCVANAARNCNKAERRRRHGAAETQRFASAQEAAPPVSQVVLDEEFSRLSQALDQLPYEQREVLVLRVYAGLTFAAIAAQQNASIYTVQGRCRYALDKMRSFLTQTEPATLKLFSEASAPRSREVTL
jgi:RNA polymerase sigma factor (sigma-70 family)